MKTGYEVQLSTSLTHRNSPASVETENSAISMIIEVILLMIMMERQRKEQHYRGDKGGFRVQFTLTNSGGVNVLLIQLTNAPKRTRYVLRIDDHFIDQQEDSFRECVESVVWLYSLLVSNFQHLEVTSDGCVILQVPVAQSMEAKKRSYRLEAGEEEINPSELYLMEFEEKVWEEMRRMQSEIASRNLQLQKVQSEGKRLQVESACCQAQRKIIFKELEDIKASNALQVAEMRIKINEIASQVQLLKQTNEEKERDQIKSEELRQRIQFSREEHYIELVRKFEHINSINPEKNETIMPLQFDFSMKKQKQQEEVLKRKAQIQQQLSQALQSLHAVEMELGDVKQELSEVQHELEERSSQNEREIIKLNDVLQALVDELERQRREDTTEHTPRDILRQSPILPADQENAIQHEPEDHQMKEWDALAPYAYKFNLNGGRAERIDYGMYQVTTLALKPKTTASIKVEYGGNRAIIIGIITQRRKQQRYSGGGQDETLAYVTYPNRYQGNIYMDNKVVVELKSNLFVSNEGVLGISTDLHQKTVTFTNVSTGRQENIELAPCFWEKELFMFATMFDKGSKVTFV